MTHNSIVLKSSYTRMVNETVSDINFGSDNHTNIFAPSRVEFNNVKSIGSFVMRPDRGDNNTFTNCDFNVGIGLRLKPEIGLVKHYNTDVDRLVDWSKDSLYVDYILAYLETHNTTLQESGLDLFNVDFQGRDMGSDLTNLTLCGVDFTGMCLTDVDLTNSNLGSCKPDGKTIKQTVIRHKNEVKRTLRDFFVDEHYESKYVRRVSTVTLCRDNITIDYTTMNHVKDDLSKIVPCWDSISEEVLEFIEENA